MLTTPIPYTSSYFSLGVVKTIRIYTLINHSNPLYIVLFLFQALFKQFGSGREEDRMSGYIKFLKIGPKLLKYIPGDKAKDLKTWLTVYSYWSEGAAVNVESMLYTIINTFQLSSTLSTSKISAGEGVVESGPPGLSAVSEGVATPTPQAVVEYPQQGLFHPDLVTRSIEWIETAKQASAGGAGTVDADTVVVSTNYMSR